MNTRFASLVAAGCLAFAALAHAQPAAPQAADQRAADPLYAALGGQPGLVSLMDDFVPRLAGDARIGAQFKDTNLRELKKQLVDQFCVVSGGPCAYEGATMKKAHADLKIDKADFNRLVELLQDSMDAKGIAFTDQNRLLARLAPMHRDVITTR